MSKPFSKTPSSKELTEHLSNVYLSGVPNFKLQSLTSDFVENLRRVVRQHITTQKSYTNAQQADAYQSMNKTLRDIEKQVNEILDDDLRQMLSDM